MTLLVQFNNITTLETSILNFAAPLWAYFLSDTQWRGIQKTYSVLRKATGCVKKNPAWTTSLFFLVIVHFVYIWSCHVENNNIILETYRYNDLPFCLTLTSISWFTYNNEKQFICPLKSSLYLTADCNNCPKSSNSNIKYPKKKYFNFLFVFVIWCNPIICVSNFLWNGRKSSMRCNISEFLYRTDLL